MKRRFWVVFGILFCFLSFVALAQKDDNQIWLWQKTLERSGDTADKVRVLNQLAQNLHNIAPQEALQYAESALSLAQKLKDKKGEVNALVSLAMAYNAIQQDAKAQANLTKALQIAETINYPQGKTDALNQLGWLTWQNQNRPDALAYFQKAKATAEKSNYTEGQANHYHLLGKSYAAINADEALKNLVQAGRLYEQNKQYVQSAHTEQAIADVYQIQKHDISTALLHYQKALQIGDQLADERILTENLNAIGSIHQDEKNEPKTALRYYFQSMVIAQEYDFITNGSKLAQALKGIYTTYQKIGNQTRAEGNEARAKEYHKLALSYQDMYQTIKKADYDVKLYTTANTKPRTYAMPNVPNTKRNTTAEPAAEIKRNNSTTPNRKTEDKTSVLAEAEGVARKQLSTDSLLIAQKDAQIITLSEKNKQKEQQYEQLNTEKEQHEEEARKYRFIWIASSIASIMILLGTLFYALYLQKNQKQVITQQKEKIVAHNEKVNRQIILLREQEAAVLKKEAELAVAYAKIDDAKLEGNSLHYLLQEDVYYPLVSLLMKAYQEEISKDLMYQSGKQILNTLYTLLEVQNFAYTSIQLQNQPLAPIFQKSVEQANELLKGRKIEVLNLIPASLSANFDTVMLERVFYNFIQNSLEYVPEGGKISVDAFEKNGWIVINYQDNGPSVSAKHLHLVFSKFAPEEARPSALGLPYVKVAIEKQGGVIEVTSPYPNCLRFTFSLPQV